MIPEKYRNLTGRIGIYFNHEILCGKIDDWMYWKIQSQTSHQIYEWYALIRSSNRLSYNK